MSWIEKTLKQLWRHSGAKTAYYDLKFNTLLKEWSSIRKNLPKRSISDTARILIIPPDPLLITSSKGDEAMLMAVIDQYRKRFQGSVFFIATAGTHNDVKAESLGAKPIPCLARGMSFAESIDLINAVEPSHSVTIGADVLDGSYDPCFSGRLLMLTDLVSVTGVNSIVTGFSVSNKAYKGLDKIFQNCEGEILFNLRDPLSFERFNRLFNARSALVADVAFLLIASAHYDGLAELEDWIASQRNDGKKILGVNFHPLVLDLNDRHLLKPLITQFFKVLETVIQEANVSVVLIEHDFRDASADKHCLDPLENLLKEKKCNYFRHANPLKAQDLKRLSQSLDGIISGRMHLMIASIGAGTPVFGIEYKDKMTGLLNHVTLDPGNITTAAQILEDPLLVVSKINKFVNSLDAQARKIAERKPYIKDIAMKNFSEMN